MIEKFIKYILTFVGLSMGVSTGNQLADYLYKHNYFELNKIIYEVTVPVIVGLAYGVVAFLLSELMFRLTKKLAHYAQTEIEKIPQQDFIFGLIGALFGMMIAYLTSGLFEIIPISMIANAFKVLSFIFLGYLGTSLSIKIFKEQSKFSDWAKKITSSKAVKPTHSLAATKPKILDTSVVIDGRILDICKTGFLEGDLIIAEFVLKELRHIADSSDTLKRNRGRRGLDVLKLMQEEYPLSVKIVDIDFEDIAEVDVKLIRLAQKLNGSIVTNDYNLNKVASLQNIVILNINELSNAVKPVVLPGEEMFLQIVKEGKEFNQGISYLDDGTMIVVEDGRKFMNEQILVVVTSVLQTAAGRMIFAKSKAESQIN